MLIRNYKGNLVHFDTDKYANEKDMYIELWKIMYNIVLPYSNANTNEKIQNYLFFEKKNKKEAQVRSNYLNCKK